MNRKAILVCMLILAIAQLKALDTVRVCSYNLLKFSQSNEDGRIPQFKRILDSIRPHIMLSQEVEDNTVGPRFVSEVFTWAPFAVSPYIEGPDTESLVFYDQSMFDLVSTRVIPTDLRNILEVTLALRPHDAVLADTIVVYSVHLKASDGTTEAAQRFSEITTLINSMSLRQRVIISGDFNIYSPSEQAYTALVGPTASRKFVDPLGNNWRRNDAAFASIYTQCTRKVTLGSCGGGVDGGLDDRFDLILASETLSPRVISSTYTPFGNDGVPRLNDAIDVPTNTRVSAEMAAALKCASDHLPSFVDVILGDVQAGVDDETSTTLRASWDAPYVHLKGLLHDGTYRLYSANGSLVATVVASSTEQRFHLPMLATGSYTINGPEGSTRFVVVR
ncbi:MAG: hypothetical protein NTX15_07900 [Candidatus Kapabacteria bacterium]|nr:hypothetical protein [Candidatus Kapabacteria bacterium]